MPSLIIAGRDMKPLRRVDVATMSKITIGRSTRSDLIVSDAAMSRLHCVLYLEGDRWFVVDAGSDSGTSINGTRVGRKRILEDSVIEIGDTRLWIDWGADDFGGELVGDPEEEHASIEVDEPAPKPLLTPPTPQEFNCVATSSFFDEPGDLDASKADVKETLGREHPIRPTGSARRLDESPPP